MYSITDILLLFLFSFGGGGGGGGGGYRFFVLFVCFPGGGGIYWRLLPKLNELQKQSLFTIIIIVADSTTANRVTACAAQRLLARIKSNVRTDIIIQTCHHSSYGLAIRGHA